MLQPAPGSIDPDIVLLLISLEVEVDEEEEVVEVTRFMVILFSNVSV